MKLLLKKEEILFNSVMNKKSNKDTISALSDYMNFITNEGQSLLMHLGTSLVEYQKEQKEIELLYETIYNKIKKSTRKLEKEVIKLDLNEDVILKDRLHDLNTFLDGNVISIGIEPLESPYMEYMDILRRLNELGHKELIKDDIIWSSGSEPYIKDSTTFKDRKSYYELKNNFHNKHSRTVIGALMNIVEIYQSLQNNTQHAREKYIANIEKVHNSIKLEYIKEDLEKPIGDNVIFYIKNNDIYHHEIGKLEYRKRGLNDPKYIKAFKNVIRYFPVSKNKMSMSEFKNKIHKNDIIDCDYRTTLGKSARSFNGFLKKNNVVNINFKNSKKVLDVTDAYITFYNSLK